MLLSDSEKARQAATVVNQIISAEDLPMQEHRIGVFTSNDVFLGIMANSNWTYAGLKYAREILGFKFKQVTVTIDAKITSKEEVISL